MRLELTKLLKANGISPKELTECLGVKENSYRRIAYGFENGTMTIKRLSQIAECSGIPAHTLIAYYAALQGQTDPEDSDEVTIFVLENMRRRDPDLAFAYYLELLERDKVTPPIKAWADTYLSSLL